MQCSYSEIVRGTDLDRRYLWLQEHRRGFSRVTLGALKRKYPDLDLDDMVLNYPLLSVETERFEVD